MKNRRGNFSVGMGTEISGSIWLNCRSEISGRIYFFRFNIMRVVMDAGCSFDSITRRIWKVTIEKRMMDYESFATKNSDWKPQ